MAITLGGISLPDDLIIPSIHQYSGIRAVKMLSLTGVPYRWEGRRYDRNLWLIGTQDSGWIDLDTLVALQNLSTTLNGVHTLVYETILTTKVRFQHEEDQVIECEPLIRKPNELTGDWFHSLVIKIEQYKT